MSEKGRAWWGHGAVAAAIVYVAGLGVVLMKSSFVRDPERPGTADLIAGAESRAVAGYFAVVLAGFVAVAWYAEAPRLRRVLAFGALAATGVTVYALVTRMTP